jgi:hypothetical protein
MKPAFDYAGLALATCIVAVCPVRAGAAESPARPDSATVYRQECGACHVAFAPRLLPPASWSALMGNLPRHFGTDASVDPATRKRLAAWLDSQGAAGRARPEGDRITQSAWFRHEHSELPAGAWARPPIKSPSNCGACHMGADSGVFDEHDIRIPH